MSGTGADLSPEERVREYVLSALERRRHSRRELEIKIARKGLSREAAGPVLDRLTEVGLVDDEAFARAYVESRQRSRPRGRRALASELGARGVDRDTVERVLADLREEEPAGDAARRAVAGRLRGLEKLPREEARRKAGAFLARRGFAWSEIEPVLDEVLPTGD
jgi:regulatory protein